MTQKKAQKLAGAVLLIAASACESDAKKLERLKLDRHVSSLRILMWQQRLEPDTARGTAKQAMEDSLRAAITQRELAERAFNRFMLGR